MRKVLLVRFGEVHLKGLNSPYFLNILSSRNSSLLQYRWPEIRMNSVSLSKVLSVATVSGVIDTANIMTGRTGHTLSCAVLLPAAGSFCISSSMPRTSSRFMLSKYTISGASPVL